MKESLRDLDTEVVVLDGDSLGAFGRGGFIIGQITKAVHHLQTEGLKVILVRNQAVAEHLRGTSTTFDESRLLQVPCLSETIVDALKVAEEYQCFFLTNLDVAALEDDWRLPLSCQRWLRRYRSYLHVRFAFDGAGTFRVDWPEQAPRRAKGATPSHVQLPPASGKSLSSSACGMPPPQPTMRQPSDSLPSETAPKSNTSDCDMLRPQGGWPPVVVLKSRSSSGAPPIICVTCEDPRSWLFPHAAELAMGTTQADLAEDEDDAYLLNEIRQARIGDWYNAVTVTEGRYKGLRGVGLGGKQKSRKRAAKLALAAYSRVKRGGPVENPSCDGEFAFLVDTVRALLDRISVVADGVDSASQNGLPPPPPPGAPPQEARQVPPPPPPPPPEEFDIVEPVFVQDEAAESSERSIQPSEVAPDDDFDPTASKAEQLLDWLKGSVDSNVPPSSPQPGSHVNTNCAGLNPQLQQASLDRFAHGPTYPQSTRADSKRVVAVGTYQPEGEGYLPLVMGDSVELLCEWVEPGTSTDLYPRYAYGQLINEALYHARMTGRAIVGWFPYDLCRSVRRPQVQRRL